MCIVEVKTVADENFFSRKATVDFQSLESRRSSSSVDEERNDGTTKRQTMRYMRCGT